MDFKTKSRSTFTSGGIRLLGNSTFVIGCYATAVASLAGEIQRLYEPRNAQPTRAWEEYDLAMVRGLLLPFYG